MLGYPSWLRTTFIHSSGFPIYPRIASAKWAYNVKSNYFSVAHGLIEFEGPATDTHSFVFAPLLSLNQLCDRGNFTWFDCSRGQCPCEARWNMKLTLCTQRYSYDGQECQLGNKGNVFTDWCAAVMSCNAKLCFEFYSVSFVSSSCFLLPSASLLLPLSLLCCPLPFFFFLAFQTLFWYIIDPLKGSPDAPDTSTISTPAHTHTHNQICWFLSIKPRQLFASC